MKRHLLLQEANNLLLQADITRREAELLHYKEYSRKGTPIKRWNTFSGEEGRQRVVRLLEFILTARIMAKILDDPPPPPSKRTLNIGMAVQILFVA